jgi:nucleotide-binding universal stress UspA family protein
MFKRILLPLDGSELAENVIPFASYLARIYTATLVLFHVVEKNTQGQVHGQHHLKQAEEARSYLQKLSEFLTADGISAVMDVHEVQESGVAQTIHDHAVELNADLIILCAHGKGGLRDLLFGSIAQQVIRFGTTPVLCIRPDCDCVDHAGAFRKILLPLDGSPAHEVAIAPAADLARHSGAAIDLLTVVPTADTLPMKDAIASRHSPRATAMTLDIYTDQAADYLDKVGLRLSTDGIQVNTLIARGETRKQMSEVIARGDYDLIVLATHSNSAIDAQWAGNLTPRFLPDTPVPVLLIRGAPEPK